MFSSTDKSSESKTGLSKQAIRLHGKIISGREASSFSNDNLDGLNNWTKVFSELSIDGDDTTKISSEVSSVALEFLMLETIKLFSRNGSKSNLTESLENNISYPDSTTSSKTYQRESSITLHQTSPLASQASQSVSSLKSNSVYSQQISQSKSGSFDAPNQRDPLFLKLENLGFRVGLSLVERFTMDHSLFSDTLDVVKFVCKEYWMLLFRKQIDNLKTNHRGVYVLTDNHFLWLSRLMPASDAEDSQSNTNTFTWFPCGLIRGALSGLGQSAFVIAESNNPPLCKIPYFMTWIETMQGLDLEALV